MLLESKPYYTYSFGSMGTTLETARKTGFFQWFHMAETERRKEEPGELVRFRPSGDKFHDLCFLDVLMAPAGEMVRMELVVRRSFIDGSDSIFAQDLVNSFLHAVLPDACQSVLEEFFKEINTPAGEGQTAGFLVFKGRQDRWSTKTGWSQLQFANTPVAEAPSLVVNVGPNPEAPNAKRIPESSNSTPWGEKLKKGESDKIQPRPTPDKFVPEQAMWALLAEKLRGVKDPPSLVNHDFFVKVEDALVERGVPRVEATRMINAHFESKRLASQRWKNRFVGAGWGVVAIACYALFWMIFGNPFTLFAHFPALAVQAIHLALTGDFVGAMKLAFGALIAIVLMTCVVKSAQKWI